MSKTSSNFRVSCFRNRMLAWIMLTLLGVSLLPSISLAQQPTVRIRTLSGNVLVSGQAATVGTVLQAGDTIQTQVGAAVVLALSDGSTIVLSENTQVNIADLTQTVTGARVSRVKLLWGTVRAFLSSQHQLEGSAFDIETPNALVGVKFSEPDIEVSYNLERAETVGIAHTVELLAKNLVTGETMLVPVGSSVIITAVGIKVIAGIVGVIGSTGTGTGTAGAGSASGGSSGISTGTITTVGAAAAAAGGVAAIVANIEEKETAESTGDLSGTWVIRGTCIASGCTENTPCCPDWHERPDICGIEICDHCTLSHHFDNVIQTGNSISGSATAATNGYSITLTGTKEGNSVSFTLEGGYGLIYCSNPTIMNYEGTLVDNTITGSCSGEALGAPKPPQTIQITGTFTVTIRK